MSMSIEEFAQKLLQKYDGKMDADAHQLAREDFEAGEYEVAAISVVEMAPVTEAELDELLALSVNFYGTDAEVTPIVVAKARERLRRTA